jgi:SAM-dependent methyltransferase
MRNGDAVDEMIPDYSVADYVGGGGAEVFKMVGLQMVDRFKSLAGLQPHESVLEVGCGIGRIAVPLTQYLETGSYDGFDIVPSGIEWCQRKITPRYPNFRFYVADVHNQLYHPAGRSPASEYTFPFEDARFDFVFLTSVFTHMLPADLERYTAEIGRVLKPGGRCFCTAYLVSADARRHLEQGTSVRGFKKLPGGHWTDNPEIPEAAVGYDQDYLVGAFAARGLETRHIIPGEWWKNEFAQDILVARKS